jgi:excisionase family DNA binding protein
MRSSTAVREAERTQEANRSEPERFVDAVVAAKFLSIQRRQLLQLARAGKIPAYPIGDGQRRLWRFRLSDLASAMKERMTCGKNTGTDGKTRPIR